VSRIAELWQFVATDGAPVLSLEPSFDAVGMKLVEAGQRQDLVSLLVHSHAN